MGSWNRPGSVELQRDGSLCSSGGGQGYPFLGEKLLVFYEVAVVVMVQRDTGDGCGQSTDLINRKNGKVVIIYV